MSKQLENEIISHLRSDDYQPADPHTLASKLGPEPDRYNAFRHALREMIHAGRVILGTAGTIVLPGAHAARDVFTGTYRHISRPNSGGFGFVIPTDPQAHEDLYIPEGHNGGAITGDIVRAKVTHSRRGQEGKTLYEGRVTEIVQRTQRRFVGTLVRTGNEWTVLPDGKAFTDVIRAPDAASRHIRPGAKVVIELTSYPEPGALAQGVITEVLGAAGEKDVDLKSVIVQFNLPGPFPQAVLDQARAVVDAYDPAAGDTDRYDLSDQVICTIDPDDAKDYDDAISLRKLDDGHWELGVHIADVSHFVPEDSALDQEARARGNSCYFPGFVIPMLPEILSNGVCSLQESVPRFCKSVFITYDDTAMPVGTKFANTTITSRKRLRYREAQALIDGATDIPHPEGPRRPSDYPAEVIRLLLDMNTLAKRLQKRRLQQGQLVLDLPEVELVLDEDGKVVDAVEEDQSFTHTLIEMFMVEGNEAVARLLDSLGAPFIRRVHPEPEPQTSERLRHFALVSGHTIDKVVDRAVLQRLLAGVRGKPEAFAINMAVLKSLTRAEYSPEPVGHYALASEKYCHFTSPIRRYADLTIHRLLDAYFEARALSGPGRTGAKRRPRVEMDREAIPSYDQLVELGRQISFTERRADDAERELRQVKILTLLKDHLGDVFSGVVSGITNFGIFVQLGTWLIDGLIRYEDLMDDWWDVDERSGSVHGQRTGKRIRIGDVMKVIVVSVNLERRELNLAVQEHLGRPTAAHILAAPGGKRPKKGERPKVYGPKKNNRRRR